MNNPSFEKTLDEVTESYKQKVEKINQAAHLGQAISRSEMNALIGINAQVTTVSTLKFHIRKGLITSGIDVASFLARTKASASRDRHDGFVAVIALCDNLLTKVRPDMDLKNF